MIIGTPGPDRLFDLARSRSLVGGFRGQNRELRIGSETQGNYLTPGKARIQQLPSQRLVAESFFQPDDAILRLQREDTAENGSAHRAEGQSGDQRRAVEARFSPRPIEVYQRSDKRQQQNRQNEKVKRGYELDVFFVTLFFHGQQLCRIGYARVNFDSRSLAAASVSKVLQ